MSRVIVRRSSYHADKLKPHIFEMMSSFGTDAIRTGMRVLVKPNFLSPASPDDGLLTHPAVVRAVCEYLLQKGASVTVGDSPAMGSFEKILRDNGIRDALAGLDVKVEEFSSSAKVDIGEPFGRIDMAEEALRADRVINLPKLKTHSQMLLTLGVKNCFGCIAGFRKAEWHMRAGVNHEMFARLLVQIHRAVNPSLTILDGIIALEGPGPGRGGIPRHLGVLMASDSALAVDVTVCRMLGIDPETLPTNRVARQMGLLPEQIEIEGILPGVEDFKIPGATSLVYGPKPFQGFVRRHLTRRPVADDDLCALCGDCTTFCPAGAIGDKGKKLRFDYDRCIRCYCCIEVCPKGALRTAESFPAALFRKLIQKKDAPGRKS
ncbi:MAG TPA: DUF362 domain-containing protein [Syntrophales bacterium]|nr:DUF362 domain-containing protein [Syntrophales bacterium]HOX95130.1 DUF362 domain-containing protein [Syntrophales bacterium]HPI56050.1 DUF362 domain-containing protein [Syntrophales bacterium]HPN24060.1 DUF362 domain-containing protein [Syntrophales bacterium]HQM28339.1 DUF362 domain-containing protein [Syntrophales bacterium]